MGGSSAFDPMVQALTDPEDHREDFLKIPTPRL